MDKAILKELKNNIKDVRIGEMMSAHTSFKIGGPADVMVLPKSSGEISSAMRIMDGHRMFVMGKGTNLLVTRKGIRGVVMKIADNFAGTAFDGDSATVKSGTSLKSFVREAGKKRLGGVEFLGGIPGTMGGAITMNAGAYGGEICEFVQEVTLATKAGIVVLNRDEMNFSYRCSILCDLPMVVVSAKLKLLRCDMEESKCKLSELNARRRDKQPLEYASAGSTFKRPDGYYAGALIEQAGLMGHCIGGAQVSEKHAGFIINKGEASADDVLELIEDVQKRVKADCGVELETEVKVVGER
jgi:UDP-N-acetylmuramate dehydrogenase